MGEISGNIDLLSGMLDVFSLRHRVIAQNVANVNTPGFHRLEVTFGRELEQALARGQAGEALRLTPQIREGGGGAERMDGNNVDIDAEMGQLSDNSTLYRTFSQFLSVQLNAMRSAISGR